MRMNLKVIKNVLNGPPKSLAPGLASPRTSPARTSAPPAPAPAFSSLTTHLSSPPLSCRPEPASKCSPSPEKRFPQSNSSRPIILLFHPEAIIPSDTSEKQRLGEREREAPHHHAHDSCSLGGARAGRAPGNLAKSMARFAHLKPALGVSIYREGGKMIMRCGTAQYSH